mmetsp:Transcript_3265/g.5985  ORF Transcript_3265/g.5985 Transcript_3265/m.5985 type:complete len:335 (-) Transcript_3265:90-1094(-)
MQSGAKLATVGARHKTLPRRQRGDGGARWALHIHALGGFGGKGAAAKTTRVRGGSSGGGVLGAVFLTPMGSVCHRFRRSSFERKGRNGRIIGIASHSCSRPLRSSLVKLSHFHVACSLVLVATLLLVLLVLLFVFLPGHDRIFFNAKIDVRVDGGDGSVGVDENRIVQRRSGVLALSFLLLLFLLRRRRRRRRRERRRHRFAPSRLLCLLRLVPLLAVLHAEVRHVQGHVARVGELVVSPVQHRHDLQGLLGPVGRAARVSVRGVHLHLLFLVLFLLGVGVVGGRRDPLFLLFFFRVCGSREWGGKEGGLRRGGGRGDRGRGGVGGSHSGGRDW